MNNRVPRNFAVAISISSLGVTAFVTALSLSAVVDTLFLTSLNASHLHTAIPSVAARARRPRAVLRYRKSTSSRARMDTRHLLAPFPFVNRVVPTVPIGRGVSPFRRVKFEVR